MLMLILMIVYNYLYSDLLQYHSLHLFCNTYTYYYVMVLCPILNASTVLMLCTYILSNGISSF